jgi:cell division protein FtsQ
MVKRIVVITIAVALFAYLVLAVTYLNPKAKKDKICGQISVEVVDKQENRYLNENEIIRILQKNNMDPVGKHSEEISTEKIEKILEDNQLIKQAECYKTISGEVKVIIHQRTPVLRVMANDKSYYIDNEGKVMPVLSHFTAYVPVATGYITEEFAQKQLYEFTQYLQKDKFWDAQIEQIYVAPNKDIELTPRVGNHQILLGKIENYPENLAKLKLFYERGLSQVGWNKYARINLKYKNQVVCTKV